MGAGARKKPDRKKRQPLKRKERLRPLSLFPIDFDTAIAAILAAGDPQNAEDHKMSYNPDSDK